MTGNDGLFGLLGPVVGWGSIALAVGAFAAGLLVVPRIVRSGDRVGWRGRAAQALALLLCAALTLLAAGVWLNRSFVLVGSWADLLDGAGGGVHAQLYGGATGHSAASQDGAAPRTPAERASLEAARSEPVTDLQADPLHDRALTKISDTSAGQYVPVRIPGPGASSEALVHLPAGYLRHPARRYPVILAFSGYPGTPRTWSQVFQVGEKLDELAREGRIAPSIVVIPDVYPGRADTECVDADPAAGGHQEETWIVRDVASWARTHLRTIESPYAWATLGYSAGGWCASMIALLHPDLARASISLAGYFRPLYSAGQAWTAADDPRYDLPAISARDHPPVAMYAFAGGEDALASGSARVMAPSVAAPSSLRLESTRHGGHMITLWVAHLPPSLAWLGSHAAGFSPRTPMESAPHSA